MLKGISPIISPELLKILMEMGHGDEIVLADGNFPAASHSMRLINCHGLDRPELLTAILELFPLDTYVQFPVMLMNPVKGDNAKPEIWKEYEKILAESDVSVQLETLERQDFYERSKTAFAIVATSEKAQYANLILKKGVVLSRA